MIVAIQGAASDCAGVEADGERRRRAEGAPPSKLQRELVVNKQFIDVFAVDYNRARN